MARIAASGYRKNRPTPKLNSVNRSSKTAIFFLPFVNKRKRNCRPGTSSAAQRTTAFIIVYASISGFAVKQLFSLLSQKTVGMSRAATVIALATASLVSVQSAYAGGGGGGGGPSWNGKGDSTTEKELEAYLWTVFNKNQQPPPPPVQPPPPLPRPAPPPT